MKKAAEYVALFEGDGKTADGLKSIMKALINDVKEICRARTVKTNGAVFSVFIETDQKFQSFRKSVATLADGTPIPKDEFRKALRDSSPDLFEKWNCRSGYKLIEA